MISAQNAVINGGDFRQSINIHNTEPAINILMKYVATSAFHNSTNRIDGEEAPRLHPSTRVAVRDRVLAWFRRTDIKTAPEQGKSALWITGAAGAGKTAIVQSLAEDLHQMTTLSASFFFNRSDPARNHARFLIATWAYQIYHKSPPEIQQAILRAIESHPLIFDCDIFTQFQTVIANPLRVIIDAAYLQRFDALPVLIIDGLDECMAQAMQRKILDLVVNTIQHWETPFLFLIASRPEVQIADILANNPGSEYCVSIDLNLDPRRMNDIELYLLDALRKCAKTHPLRRYLPAGWPPQSSIDVMVSKSSGNFIYASTALRYITSLKHHPHRRLDDIIRLTPQSHNAFADLDALYTHILHSAETAYPLRQILALCLRFPSMTINQIEKWLCLPQGAVAEALSDMGSLTKTSPGNRIRILHASFGDYIFNASRAGEMYVDKRQLLRHVAMEMVSYLMSALFLYSGWTYCETFAEQDPGNFAAYFFEDELLYSASTYIWACLGNAEIDAQLVQFFSTNFKIADKLTAIQKYSGDEVLDFYADFAARGIPPLCRRMDNSESEYAHQLSSYLRAQFDTMACQHICAPRWTRPRSFQAATILITSDRSEDLGKVYHRFADIIHNMCGCRDLPGEYLQELRRFFLDKLIIGGTFSLPFLFAEASYFCLDKLCSGPKSYSKHHLPALSLFLQRTRRDYPRKWRRKRLFVPCVNRRLTPIRIFPSNMAKFLRNMLYPYTVKNVPFMDARPAKYSARLLSLLWKCGDNFHDVNGVLTYKTRCRQYTNCLQLLPRFLRRAGKSDDLIRLCRTSALTAQSQDFPRPSRRARAAIWEYLMKWCGPEGVSGARE